MKPVVSIVMPTYNRGYCIESAIRSVIAQSVENWELLVIDDGSSDDTSSIVKAFSDERIHYEFQKNQGAASARNKGVAMAKADWIAYLDSDNELFPTFIEDMMADIVAAPKAVFAMSQAKRTMELYKNGKLVKTIDDSSNTPKGLTVRDIFLRNFHVDTNGFMHLRRLFDEGISWDENLPALEDWDLAMTMGERNPDGFLYVEEVLYHYHQRYGGDGTVSNTGYGKWADIFEQIYQKHKDDKLLAGQTWYPERVQKWRRLQAEYEAGKLPPYEEYYFQGT